MPQVKVRRRGISAEDMAAVIRGGLGERVEITPKGGREIDVRKSFFTRARVVMTEEPGGTVVDVRGVGAPIPLVFITTLLVNNRGIAQRVASVIGAHGGFQDSG